MSRTIFTFLVFSISLLAQVTSIPGATGGGGGGATASGYSAAVSAQTTLTVTAATHGQGTSPVAGCFDNSTPAVSVSCSYTRNTSGDVVFTWAPAFTGTVNIWAGAGTSGISGGGNLTTVGAIPYVSSSGVLNQDATNLFWDATNHRLGVGTASPGYSIQVTAPASTDATVRVLRTSTTNYASYDLADTGSFSASNILWQLGKSPGSQYFSFRTWNGSVNTDPLAINAATGSVMIGGTTDGNYRLDVQKSGSTGTLRVFDQTATTGSTLAVIQAGAGQSGNLLETKTSAGVTVNSMSNAGLGIGTSTNPGLIVVTSATGQFMYADPGTNSIRTNSVGMFSWANVSNASGTIDLGLARNAAGVLEINNGTAGTLRDLKLRNITVMDTTAVTGSTLAVIQAGAGQSGNLLSVRNNSGTEIAYVGNTGSVVGEAVYGKTIKNSPAGVAFAFHDGAYSTAGGYFQSTFPLVWNSDAGFKRSAAGYMAVTDGSTGLGKIVVSQSTPSASTDACTAGAIWADATYIYACTASGTIKRATLATF